MYGQEPIMKATLLLSVFLFITLSAVAQNPPTINAQTNTVYVSAEGKYESAPDTAMVQFMISAQEELAKDAYSRASQEADQLRTILRTNGIDPKTAEIGFFSLQPVYDYRNPKHKVVGYRVTTSVSLKLKDFAKVGAIVGSVGDQEWAENVSLNYTLEDIDAAKLHAVDDAFQRARAEAAAVARAGGRALGEMSYASVDTYEQVRVLASPMAAQRSMAVQGAAVAPTAEFSPQKISVTARVSTMFALK
jgi:uncharacterized protein YggE